MTKNFAKPNIIITDFDRTIAYLYRDTNLLKELNKKIVHFYSNYVEIPHEISNRDEDGYFVWHKLHDFISKIQVFNYESINKKAEELVTNFEIDILKKVGLLEGIKESIIFMKKKNIKLAIVSNNGERAIRYVLDVYKIESLFDYIGGRPYPFDPKLIKPNSYPIDVAIEHLDTQESDVIWYTGDDIMDMIAATRANVIPVGVFYGRHSEEELIKSGAILTFSSFNDILTYLNK